MAGVGAGGPGSLASCPRSPGAQYRGSRLHARLGLSLCALLGPLVLLSVLIPPQFSPLSLDSSISAVDFLHFGLSSSHFCLCLHLPHPTLSSSRLLCLFLSVFALCLSVSYLFVSAVCFSWPLSLTYTPLALSSSPSSSLLWFPCCMLVLSTSTLALCGLIDLPPPG